MTFFKSPCNDSNLQLMKTIWASDSAQYNLFLGCYIKFPLAVTWCELKEGFRGDLIYVSKLWLFTRLTCQEFNLHEDKINLLVKKKKEKKEEEEEEGKMRSLSLMSGSWDTGVISQTRGEMNVIPVLYTECSSVHDIQQAVIEYSDTGSLKTLR